MNKLLTMTGLITLLSAQVTFASLYSESRIVKFEFNTTQSYELEEDALAEAFEIEASIKGKVKNGPYSRIFNSCSEIKRIQKPIIVKLKQDSTGKSIGRVIVKVRCL